MVLAIAIPIMIQNGITNFVSLLDNIMVGQIGTEQMSGVAIVNQLIFVYNLCIFGGVSGAGIFTAQYFGQKDDEGIRHTFRFKLWVSAILTCAGYCDFYHQWRKPDPDLSERQQRWRRSGGCTSLWKTVHAGDVMRTAGLYDGADICEYASRVRRDAGADESRCDSGSGESGI